MSCIRLWNMPRLPSAMRSFSHVCRSTPKIWRRWSRRAPKPLQAAQVQLQRADKLAALGTLAAGIAHEINNPLQPVLTNLELTLEDIDAGQGVDREMLDFARQEVQRIKRIVAGLLDFARPAKAELGPVNVNKVMEEVIGLARKQLEHARVTNSDGSASAQANPGKR